MLKVSHQTAKNALLVEEICTKSEDFSLAFLHFYETKTKARQTQLQRTRSL